MGIHNIHILNEPEIEIKPMARKAQEMVQVKRIEEHRRGEHPYGLKRRDCPLCRSGK